MLLSSIQIQGFKSFADKTVLKFGKGITAVVGPNGSGKSNISDAVRWVLGEQSTKSLRGQSMEDVIFGGTDSRRPHGFCEVTLNIDNSDRSLNFDNDSVSVTRRYYRSHESEYLINNISVRLKDVHELFMDTGLGRDGYSMIGQGKIDNIISSKSDERRDIFEEASGISKYRYRKLEAERKLSAAEDNLLRLKDIMDELKSRVGPLEEQSRKAEMFLDLSQNKKELEIGLWLYTLDNSKDLLRAQESKIAAAQLKYREIEDALGEFDAKAEENSAEYAKITAEIEAKRAEISSANEQTVKLEGNINIIKNDILHNNETILRLDGERQQLNSSDSNDNEKIENKHKQIADKRIESDALKNKLSELEADLSSLLTDSERISRDIEERVKELNALSAEIADKRVEITSADVSISEISARRDTVDLLIGQNISEAEDFQRELDETEALLRKTEDSITADSNALKGYELRFKNRNDDVENCRGELDGFKLDLEAKRRRIQILKELEHNMEGFSHAVKQITAESDKGTLRGIHGPVSKLISVEKKYTVAIETALGNAIQNIVVDSESDAKRAISFLKSHNSGRATFLPIESIKARELKENSFDDVFGFVGIAADLVSSADKYSEIIRYLLGGVAVTEDIDSAVTIAKKHNYRIKVVSLDGQVINPGGSLTGGSLVKQAGLLSRAADIKRLEEDCDKLSEKISRRSKEFETAKAELSKVNADITSVRAELTAANEDKIRILAEIKRINGLIQNTNSVIEELKSEKSGGEEKLKALEETVKSAKTESEKLESNKSQLQKALDEMTGGRDGLSAKREDITSHITEVKLAVIECEKDIQTLLASVLSLENANVTRAKRLEEIEAEIAALSFKNEQLNADIAAVADDIDNCKLQVTECNKEIEKLLDKRNATEKFGAELRLSERERTTEREKISGELARLCERKEIMVKEYDDVIRQLYDEYQLTKSEAEKIGIVIEKPTDAKKQLAEIKSKIRGLGNVNVSAIEEYKEVKERYDFLSAQIDDVETSRAELHKLINQLTAQMQELFIEGFDKINENFKVTFRELFGGGDACLKLSDPENVLESGIDIEARLPGKNVPSLDGLSGGEKALVALSIYFSIMQVNAPPFCFLDEVDTALDDINVDRFADYMKQSGFPTQFICVTHRRGTMEAADMLYGVTMQEKGVTKLLELDVAQLEKQLKLGEQGA